MTPKVFWTGFVLSIILIVIIAMIAYPRMYKMLPAHLDRMMPTTPYEDWREFQYPPGNFTVDFPSIPQHAKENITDPTTHQVRKYDMFVSERVDGSTFMVSLIVYPETIEDPKKVLKAVLDEMLALNHKNKLESVNENTYKSFDAIDFLIKNADVTIKAKGFVVKNTVYLLTYINQTSDFQESDFNHFLNTFKLL